MYLFIFIYSFIYYFIIIRFVTYSNADIMKYDPPLVL